MSYSYGGYAYTLLGSFGDIVAKYGPILLYGSIIYSILGIVVYLWMISSGITAPVTLIPPGLAELASKTYSLWNDIYNVFKDGKIGYLEALKLGGLIGSASLLLMGMLAQSAINYIWIAVQLSELIPPPYQFMLVIIWAVLGMAQLILLLYIVQRMMPFIQSIIQSIIGFVRRYF